MTMTLKDYCDGLRLLKSQPVSFELHCELGHILDADNEPISEMEHTDKILLEPEEIPFIL